MNPKRYPRPNMQVLANAPDYAVVADVWSPSPERTAIVEMQIGDEDNRLTGRIERGGTATVGWVDATGQGRGTTMVAAFTHLAYRLGAERVAAHVIHPAMLVILGKLFGRQALVINEHQPEGSGAGPGLSYDVAVHRLGQRLLERQQRRPITIPAVQVSVDVTNPVVRSRLFVNDPPPLLPGKHIDGWHTDARPGTTAGAHGRAGHSTGTSSIQELQVAIDSARQQVSDARQLTALGLDQLMQARFALQSALADSGHNVVGEMFGNIAHATQHGETASDAMGVADEHLDAYQSRL